MTIHWAHIDASGNIVTWGTSIGTDVFLQYLADGLTAVSRPPDVTGYDNWRYTDNQWVQETPGENS